MREVILEVPRIAVEDVLDRLLPIVPTGVREVPRGHGVELRMRGDDLPSAAAVREAAGRWPCRLTEREVPDDPRERRLADYEPQLIGGRLVVRPEWAPPAAERAIDIVLGESSAFGGGSHPTTRVCLELLLAVTPRGAFADLGCGTGVLAILAARLGWAPVHAFDLQPGSVEATRRNAALNGVAIDAREADLTETPPPRVAGFAANVPASLHPAVAAGWSAAGAPRLGLLSGFSPGEAPAVLDAYAALGLRETRRREAGGWTVVLVER